MFPMEMSSRDRYVARQMCFRKKEYGSEKQAQEAVRIMKARGVNRNDTLHAYLCDFCFRWHVGHAQRS